MENAGPLEYHLLGIRLNGPHDLRDWFKGGSINSSALIRFMATVRSTDYKAPGGKLVRVLLGEENGKIQFVRLTGDFFLIPEESLGKLEKMLVGAPLRESELHLLVSRFFSATRAKGLGVGPDDFVKALISAEASNQ